VRRNQIHATKGIDHVFVIVERAFFRGVCRSARRVVPPRAQIVRWRACRFTVAVGSASAVLLDVDLEVSANSAGAKHAAATAIAHTAKTGETRAKPLWKLSPKKRLEIMPTPCWQQLAGISLGFF